MGRGSPEPEAARGALRLMRERPLEGALAEGCAKLCSGRASYAGLEVQRMSESVAEAAAMRDASGKRLCGE